MFSDPMGHLRLGFFTFTVCPCINIAVVKSTFFIPSHQLKLSLGTVFGIIIYIYKYYKDRSDNKYFAIFWILIFKFI